MTRILLSAVALVLLGAAVASADIPSPDPMREPSSTEPTKPVPPPKPDAASTGCGLGVTASLVLAGVWLAARSRRRMVLAS